MKKTIQLKNADKLFSASITRLSPHDFMKLGTDKRVSKEESKRLLKIAESDLNGDSDLIVQKEKGKIILRSF